MEAHQEPGPGLIKAARRYTRAIFEIEAARNSLRTEVQADLNRGVRQVDVARVAGLTREYIRRLGAQAEVGAR